MQTNLMTQDFNGTALGLVPHDGDLWVQADEIGGCLEYAEGRKGVMKLYERSREELDPHSCVVKLTTHDHDGTLRRRSVRVFNEEGVMILTMLSRQPRAAAFRAWAVQVLKAYRRGELALNVPDSRDHLLELCITEAGKGNVAALDTLVSRYGYDQEVKAQQLKLTTMRYGKANPLIAQEAPPLTLWFLDDFLPTLRIELLAGEEGKYTRLLMDHGLLSDQVIEYQTTVLMQAVAITAEEEGIDPLITPRLFGEWLVRMNEKLNKSGWEKKLARVTHGVKIYHLKLLF